MAEHQQSAIGIQPSVHPPFPHLDSNPHSSLHTPAPEPGEGLLWRHARKLLAAGGLVEARAAEEIRIGPEQKLVVAAGDWFYCTALARDGFRRTAKSLAHGIFVRVAAVRIPEQPMHLEDLLECQAQFPTAEDLLQFGGGEACGEDDADCDCSFHRALREQRENGGAA